MNSDNRYFLINIQIPLEVKPNKENKLLSDRIEIFFSKCKDTLPLVKENHQTIISDKIREFIEKNEYLDIEKKEPEKEKEKEPEPEKDQPPEEPPIELKNEGQPEVEKKEKDTMTIHDNRNIIIHKSEIQSRKKKENKSISFKNSSHHKPREFTKKNYSIEEMDVHPSEPPTGREQKEEGDLQYLNS